MRDSIFNDADNEWHGVDSDLDISDGDGDFLEDDGPEGWTEIEDCRVEHLDADQWVHVQDVRVTDNVASLQTIAAHQIAKGLVEAAVEAACQNVMHQARAREMVRAMAASMMQVAVNQAMVAAKRLPVCAAPRAIAIAAPVQRLSLVPYRTRALVPVPVRTQSWGLAPCTTLALVKPRESVQIVMREVITAAQHKVESRYETKSAAQSLLDELVEETKARIRERQLGIALTARVMQRAVAVAEWRMHRRRIGDRLARAAIEKAVLSSMAMTQLVVPTAC